MKPPTVDVKFHKKLIQSINEQKSLLEKDLIDSIEKSLDAIYSQYRKSKFLLLNEIDQVEFFTEEEKGEMELSSKGLVLGIDFSLVHHKFQIEKANDNTEVVGIAFRKNGSFLLIRKPDDEECSYADLNLCDDLLSLPDYVIIAEALNRFIEVTNF